MPDSQSDSHFSAMSVDSRIDARWADIRLVHESSRGWCDVYVCLHSGRRIVLKALKPQFRESALHQQLLKKEYAIASMMTHQGIVSTLGMESVPGLGECILFEYVDGQTLSEYVATHEKLTNREQLRLIEQICSAVSYIHSRQMVHCDLKPSNILITRDGAFVKIIDFGLCRGIGFDLLDIPGGTQGFTAPENLTPGGKATTAADVYSIGKILKLLDRSRSLKRVWRQCLAASPADRPESVESIPLLIRRQQLRRKRTWQIAAVSGMVLLAGSIYLLLPKPAPTPEQVSEPQPIVNPVLDSTPKITAADDVEPIPEIVAADKVEPIAPAVVDEQQPSPEEPVVTLDPESPEFRKLLAEHFETVVGRRFKEHLTLIDTMTTRRSYELQLAGSWRRLAKQDMRRWLEQHLPGNRAKIDGLMQELDGHIKQWGEFSFRRAIEDSHRRDALKRNPSLSGASQKSATDNEPADPASHARPNDAQSRKALEN